MGISTHILDTALGRPAVDVPVSLAWWSGSDWITVSASGAHTDADGRVQHLLPDTKPLHPGLYRVRFDTAQYYHSQGITGLYPYVEITIEVHPWKTNPPPHYHIPLLLTANGYATYRGS